MITRTAVNLSPRAQELNHKLVATVEEFRRYYPDTTDTDVLSALRAAGISSAPRRAPAIVAAAAAALAGGIGALMAAREGTAGTWPTIIVLIAGVAFAALVVIRMTRQS
jgi:hypothetical protein